MLLGDQGNSSRANVNNVMISRGNKYIITHRNSDPSQAAEKKGELTAIKTLSVFLKRPYVGENVRFFVKFSKIFIPVTVFYKEKQKTPIRHTILIALLLNIQQVELELVHHTVNLIVQ